ncbi:hypothetical protein M2146_001184 [Lachnospiraceae bacterium PF1-22]
MKKKTIWSSDFEIDDFRDYIKEEEEEQGVKIEEDEAYHLVCDLNDSYLDDERSNLDIQLSNPIMVIADIGRWNGRVLTYKLIKSGNIRDILYSEVDFVTWYSDGQDIRFEGHHHDGTNYYLYREVENELDADTLMDLAHQHNLDFGENMDKKSRKILDKYTKSILPSVANVYGWEAA